MCSRDDLARSEQLAGADWHCYRRHRSGRYCLLIACFCGKRSELDESELRRRGVLPVIHFALIPGAFGVGDVVLRAYESLREAGIKPFAFVCSDNPRMTLAPETYQRAIAVLLAAGFDFSEA